MASEGLQLAAILPVFNEVATVREVVARTDAVPCVGQLVVVDDGSTDGTLEAVKSVRARSDLVICSHRSNRGKGAAVRTGLAKVTMDWVIVQDGDLEYDPADIARLADAVGQQGRVVYGSRLLASPRGMTLASRCANRTLTWVFNRLYGQRLTDMETCYKLVPTSLLRRVGIDQDGFGIDPELSAKLARCGETIVEVPIQYRARSAREGKKITVRDAGVALRVLWRSRSWTPPQGGRPCS